MKPIQLKRTVLDIPFMDSEGKEALVLYFDRSQENIEQFETVFTDLAAKAEQIEKKKDITWKDTENFIREAMDSILGKGAYDKVYELSPSIHIVATYFYQIAIGIKEELEAEDLKALENKYVK